MHFLDSSELDFTAYKEALKVYLSAQDKFADYDFEGSNMSVLLDLLARNTYHNAIYLNMVASEMFLDSSQLRESVVSHAKELNYVPRSRVSSQATVDIQVYPTDNPSSITIPKFYNISAPNSNGSYVFSTGEATVIQASANTYIASNVAIYEGRVVTEYFVANTTAKYVIASANVDISSISVIVQNSSADTTERVFERAYNLYGLDDDALVYFIQGAAAEKYELCFGNDITGKALDNGNIVKVTYRDCSGNVADGVRSFKVVQNIDGYSTINITTVDSSFGGSERETASSIKFNAPRHFTTQDRAITKTDYVNLIRQRFPQIESLAVYGGEELEQKRYGRVVISLKPFGADIAPTTLKNEIQSYLEDRACVTVDPVFIDPDFFYAHITSAVSFNPSLTSKTSNDIKSAVITAVLAYGNSDLIDFSNDLRFSRLTSAIDNADTAIVSNETSVTMAKHITPVVGDETTYTIRFENALETNTNVPVVSSSLFNYEHNDGVEYQCKFKDDLAGNLVLYSPVASGSDIILNPTIGTVDYSTGKIQINKMVTSGYDDHIGIVVKPKSKDFIISKNQIIRIDVAKLAVSVSKVVQ